jgi:hypothetical protein
MPADRNFSFPPGILIRDAKLTANQPSRPLPPSLQRTHYHPILTAELNVSALRIHGEQKKTNKTGTSKTFENVNVQSIQKNDKTVNVTANRSKYPVAPTV